jgi:hypothetical protein
MSTEHLPISSVRQSVNHVNVSRHPECLVARLASVVIRIAIRVQTKFFYSKRMYIEKLIYAKNFRLLLDKFSEA